MGGKNTKSRSGGSDGLKSSYQVGRVARGRAERSKQQFKKEKNSYQPRSGSGVIDTESRGGRTWPQRGTSGTT